uniref:Uncharacterized protein n=1 Tax=Anguilla anguilla TaxID=7936 RepID=A0A0E9UE62_ANGAN
MWTDKRETVAERRTQ